MPAGNYQHEYNRERTIYKPSFSPSHALSTTPRHQSPFQNNHYRNKQQNLPTININMKLTLVFAAILAIAVAAPIAEPAPATDHILQKRTCAPCRNHQQYCFYTAGSQTGGSFYNC